MIPLVVYEAADDSSARIAEVVAAKFRAPVLAAADARPRDLESADLLILGSPTHHRHHGDALRKLLDGIAGGWLIGVRTATFDTRPAGPVFRTGSAARTLAQRARELGADLVVSPRSFFVADTDGTLLEGELDRVDEWALEVARAIGVKVVIAPATNLPDQSDELSVHQYPEPLVTPLALQGLPRLRRQIRKNGRARRPIRTRV